MKRNSILLSLLVVFTIQYSCTKTEVPESGFKDQFKFTIYDFLVENKEEYSSFLSILEAGGLDKTLSAYNPGGKTGGFGYTLFVPDNQAVDEFIKSHNSQFASLADLLKDQTYVKALGKYHILNQSVASKDFPFGTFNQPNLSDDYLNVNFVVQTDTTYYLINNQAQVIKANIETSNGFVQVIGTMLEPIVYNSYGWLKSRADYSIFTAALEATGIDRTIDVDMKLEDQDLQPFTMLIESDAVYQMRGINSFEDLAQFISPDQMDYTTVGNPMNVFVGYHILIGSHFLNNLADKASNYNTFADVPLNINGKGIDILINKYKETFVSASNDTTDFVGLYYDESNVNTQSGAIHLIDQILRPQVPSQADVSFSFWEESLLNQYRNVPGTYLIENPEMLKSVSWSNAELSFVKSQDAAEKAWDQDYLQIEGDFSITYQVPKIIPGKYDVVLHVGADFVDSRNPNSVSAYPVVEIFIDGNKLGGLIDLTKGGSSTDPYVYYSAGTIDFKNYAGHSVEIKSLIPGRFVWDAVSFEIIKNNP